MSIDNHLAYPILLKHFGPLYLSESSIPVTLIQY